MSNDSMYIKSNLTGKEIADIVNLTVDGVYIPRVVSVNSSETKKAPVKKLVQNHSRRQNMSIFLFCLYFGIFNWYN